ncbi:hypothetical protein BOTBODRAFT_527408 [Botryobasidium botryosum FD-172 SS1]|uniref:C2H2-type domain-containing protein n=1 Tax=Botryobasidium botryosum (strain FD-172 SS1) TaxID=930990 RepID=A0A067MD31_BOTB1|nr:hypothetical protein BOTBODRAFT_527408 [Botryobasidium botryosum FD-172 SS1]
MGGTKSTRTIRPFPCSEPTCGKSFGTKAHLRRHMNDIHTRKRIFPCTVVGCHRVFTQAGNMRSHVKTHEKRGDVLPDAKITSGASGAAPATSDSSTREQSTIEGSSSGSLSPIFSQLSLECDHAGAPGVAPGSTCITPGTGGSSQADPDKDTLGLAAVNLRGKTMRNDGESFE